MENGTILSLRNEIKDSQVILTRALSAAWYAEVGINERHVEMSITRMSLIVADVAGNRAG